MDGPARRGKRPRAGPLREGSVREDQMTTLNEVEIFAAVPEGEQEQEEEDGPEEEDGGEKDGEEEEGPGRVRFELPLVGRHIHNANQRQENSDVVDIYPEGKARVPPIAIPHTLSKNGYAFSAGRRGFIDSMALVSAMDLAFFGKHQAGLGEIEPSSLILRMADGTKRKSSGKVRLDLILNWDGGRIKAPFTLEIVEANESWDILMGLPLITQLDATISFGKRVMTVKGGGQPRAFPAYEPPKSNAWAEENLALYTLEGDQEEQGRVPETEPTKHLTEAERAEEVLKKVVINSKLTQEQTALVEAFVREYHQAWALSLSELEAADVEPAKIQIDHSVKLPLEPTQRMSRNEALAASAYVDVLLQAKLIRPIDPYDVKCCSNIIMVAKKVEQPDQKVVEKQLDEALHQGSEASLPSRGPAWSYRGGIGVKGILKSPVTGQRIEDEEGKVGKDADLTKLYRMVFNYKPLNAAAKCAAYMPGNMQELIAKTSGKTFISIVDQLGAFYSFPLHPDSQPWTAFFVPSRGHFCHLRMAQGLAGSPATMQTGAATAYKGILGVSAEIWMDDLFTSNNSFEDHLENLRQLAKRAIASKLRWSPAKSQLFMHEAKIGGQIVDAEGVRPDPERVAAIMELPPPKTALQALSFVNKAAHFRRNIDGFSAIAAPLTDLTRGRLFTTEKGAGSIKRSLEITNIEHLWTEKEATAFKNVKNALRDMVMTVAPVYDGKTPFHIAVDACAEGFGAHLYQYQVHNTEVPATIEFASRRTNAREQNTHSFLLELKCVKWALERFRPMVHGQKVVLHTDCQAVKDLLNNGRPTFQQASWKESLLNCGMDIQFVHKAGKENKVADYLSRNAITTDQSEVQDYDGTYKGVVNDIFWVDAESPEEEELRNRFKGDELYPVVCFLTKLINSDADMVVRKSGLFWVKEGRLLTRNKALGHEMEVIPAKEGISVAKANHDECGHFGKEITIRHIQRSTTWMTLRKDVVAAIESCEVCRKFGPRLKNSLLRETLRYAPFELIAMDYLFLPRTTNGYRIALIAVDSCTKFIFGWCFDRDPSSDTCLTALKDMQTRWMLPKELVVDNQFMTKKIIEAVKGLITLTPAAPYAHVPLAENANHLILDRLRRICRVDISLGSALLPDDMAFEIWPERLQTAISALNNRRLESLGGYSPRELMFGQTDDRKVPSEIGSFAQSADNLRREALSARDHDVLKRQQPDTRPIKPFYIGQLVQVYDPRKDDTHESSRKLKTKWSGPYRITEIKGSSAVITTPDGDPAGRAGFDRLRPWRGAVEIYREEEEAMR